MKNTFVKVLSMMMALMMVVGALGVITVTAAECNHTKGELVPEKSKAPTCNAWGYSTYICGLCGEEWETDVTAPSEANHKFVDVPETPASCLSDYISAGKKCEYCGKVSEGCKPTANTRFDHQFVGTITEATCLTNKTLVYTCKFCAKTADEIKNKGLYVGGAEWVAEYTEKWQKVEYAGTATNPSHADLEWTMVVSPSCTPGKAEGFCADCKTVVRETSIPAIHGEPVELNPENHACAEYPSGVFACKDCGTILTSNAQKNPNAGQHNNTTPIFSSFTQTVSATDLPVKPEGGKFTIAELQSFGYNVGDTLGKDATCTATGVQLVQCECGAIFNKTINKKNHSYSAYTYVAPTDCTKAYVKTRTCSVCTYVDTVVLVAAANAAHNMVVVPSNANVPADQKSQDATCTGIGYTFKKCSNVDCMGAACGATAKDTYVDELGHAYGTPVFVPAAGITCTSAGNNYKKTCSRCNGSEMVAKPATVTGCTWGAEVTVAATCNEREYKYIPCTICGAWKDNPSKTHNYTTGSQLNPNNHVYATDAELKAFVEAYDADNTHTSDAALGILGFNGTQKSSCTVAGAINLKCKYCSMSTADTTKTVAAPKADHDYISGSRAIYNNGAFVSVDTNAVAVKCNQVGYAADGKFCEECGAMQAGKAPTATYFDANKQADVTKHAGTVTLVHTYDATCQKGSYAIYNTSCCGQITITISGAVAHVYDTVYAYDDPSCLEAGHHAYLGCKWCEAYKSMFVAGSVVNTVACSCGMTAAQHTELALEDNYVIAALGHRFKANEGKVSAQAATCNTAGTAEYINCSRGCGYASFGGNEYFIGTGATEAQLNTFALAIAVPAHYGANMKTFVDTDATCTSDAIIGGAYCTVCQKNEWFDAGTKLAHNRETILVNLTAQGGNYVLKDCTKDGAVLKRCKDCNDYQYQFVASTHTTHTYPNDWTTITPAATQTCYKNTVQYKECTVCADKTLAKVEQVKTQATGHYTTKGINTDDATKYYFDYSCNKINEFKDYSCKVCGQTYLALLGANGENVVHDKVSLYQKPTCTTVGYNIVSCKNNCNFTGEFAKYNLATKNETIPTVTNTGKHTIGTVLDRVEATNTTDGYVKYICAVAACGATVTDVLPATSDLVIAGAVSAAKVTAGSEIEYTVSYSVAAQKFKTLKIEVAYDASKFDFVAAESELTDNVFASASNGVVGITLVSKTDMTTGAAATELVTLKFVAKKYAIGPATFDVAEINDAAVAVDATTATVVGLGNVTGTGYITSDDALAILGTEDYKAEYDINGDGMVDLIDVALVGTFAASNQTAKDYLVMLGTYGEIQAVIDALYADGKLADCNKDGIVTINDYYALVAKVDAQLNAIGSYTNINFASVEEFVMTTMRGMI